MNPSHCEVLWMMRQRDEHVSILSIWDENDRNTTLREWRWDISVENQGTIQKLIRTAYSEGRMCWGNCSRVAESVKDQTFFRKPQNSTPKRFETITERSSKESDFDFDLKMNVKSPELFGAEKGGWGRKCKRWTLHAPSEFSQRISIQMQKFKCSRNLSTCFYDTWVNSNSFYIWNANRARMDQIIEVGQPKWACAAGAAYSCI
jgi:hypothetical protein